MSRSNANLRPVYPRKEDTSCRFFKAPKVLFYSPMYRNLSLAAKSLYFILLDRLELSVKNQWIDGEGNIFVLFKGKPAQDDTRSIDEKPWEALSLTELLNVDQRTLRKYKDELIRHDLLIEKRSGQGKTNRLYVLKPKKEPMKIQKKESPEPINYSEDCEDFSRFKTHRLLQLAYGKEALEKGLALTAGEKNPTEDYYTYIANIIESTN